MAKAIEREKRLICRESVTSAFSNVRSMSAPVHEKT